VHDHPSPSPIGMNGSVHSFGESFKRHGMRMEIACRRGNDCPGSESRFIVSGSCASVAVWCGTWREVFMGVASNP